MSAKILTLPVTYRAPALSDEPRPVLMCRHRWPSAHCRFCELRQAPWASPVVAVPLTDEG